MQTIYLAEPLGLLTELWGKVGICCGREAARADRGRLGAATGKRRFLVWHLKSNSSPIAVTAGKAQVHGLNSGKHIRAGTR